ncbi:MAG: ATP synthase subunit I [Actinomycetota bacterium]|nr:ATP synthase subunit I [Actinomycetota bacterium]
MDTEAISPEGVETLAVPPHAAANLRRSTLVSIPVGIVAIGLLALVGHPVAGLLVCVGLGIGALNGALVQRSVVRYAASEAADRKRRFVGGVFGRLMLITVVSLGLCVLLLPDGLGVLGGLAAFQVLMIASASMPLIRELRKA